MKRTNLSKLLGEGFEYSVYVDFGVLSGINLTGKQKEWLCDVNTPFATKIAVQITIFKKD